ncbi:hypothetical protein Btru_032208, partial [Bulinus truncatus]
DVFVRFLAVYFAQEKVWKHEGHGSDEALVTLQREQIAPSSGPLIEIEHKLGELREFLKAQKQRLEERDRKESIAKQWKAMALRAAALGQFKQLNGRTWPAERIKKPLVTGLYMTLVTGLYMTLVIGLYMTLVTGLYMTLVTGLYMPLVTVLYMPLVTGLY